MTIGKAISIAIDSSILSRIDQLQPSHFTRKAFVNQLLFEAVEQRFKSLTVTEFNALKSQA